MEAPAATVLMKAVMWGLWPLQAKTMSVLEGSESLVLGDVFTAESYTKLDAEAIDRWWSLFSGLRWGWWFGTAEPQMGL